MAETPSNRVRIYKRGPGWVIETGGREVPRMEPLLGCLPSAARSGFRSFYTIADALEMGGSPQLLAEALRLWYIYHPNPSNARPTEPPVLVEGITELGGPAYLTAGDTLYHLVPVEQVNAGRAIATIRRRAQDEIRRQREAALAQASTEAAEIIRQAERQRNLAREEAARLTAAGRVCVPAWYSGEMKTGDGRPLALQSKYKFMPRIWRHERKIWRTPDPAPGNPNAGGVWMKIWIPVHPDGSYAETNITAVSVEDKPSRNRTPHMHYESSCVTFGEDKLPITDYDRFLTVGSMLSRAFGTINLASLLLVDYTKWDERILWMIPPVVKEVLERTRTRGGMGEAFAEAIPDEEELEPATWTRVR